MAMALGVLALSICPAQAQSLFIQQGEHGFDGSIAWSVGPFSQGVELHGAVSIDGRWDAGFGVHRYAADFGGPDDTTVVEWTPFVRYFAVKEDDDGMPVTLAFHGQFVRSTFEGGMDGWYALGGAQLVKKLLLVEGLAFYPFLGFSLAAESSAFDAGDPDRSVYITRQFGVHGQIAMGPDTWLRLTTEEHGFRRETYRAVRLALVHRF